MASTGETGKPTQKGEFRRGLTRKQNPGPTAGGRFARLNNPIGFRLGSSPGPRYGGV